MEELLLAAILADRKAYDATIRIGLDSSDFSDTGRMIVNCVTEQYKRDASLQATSKQVLAKQFERKLKDKAMVQSYMDYVAQLPGDSSQVNIAEEYRLVRRQRVALQLATKLANGQHDDETEALLSKYAGLGGETGGSSNKFRLTEEDFSDDSKVSGRIKIAPESLDRFIGGGVLRGHNIAVYARPESGKSLFGLNQAAFSCAHGHKVLYVANEEPPEDITRRLLSRLCNRPISELRTSEAVRQALAQCAHHYAKWNLLHRAGCGIKDIKAAAADVGPDLIIVDQLKNLQANEDNRALQLDKLARQVRELGIEYKAVTMSITQAGNTADNKLVLGMNDVEWSNTGIPGAADLMIGIGLNQEYDMQNKRQLSIPKNKINGRHGNFTVIVEPQFTAFRSKRQ